MRGMQRLGTIGLLGIVLGVVGPGTSAEAARWADQLFEDRAIDYGLVPRGAVMSHRFVLTNRTSGPIQIVGIRASCGCTSGQAGTQVVEAGAQGVVEATMDTTQVVGRRDSRLYVQIQDVRGRRAEVALGVSATVHQGAVVTPGVVDFGAFGSETPAPRAVDLVYQAKPDWQVTQIVAADPRVQATLRPTRRDDVAVGYQVEVQLKPDGRAGWIRDTIRVLTNDPTMPVIPVEVRGYAQPSVTISPSRLTLRAGSEGEPAQGRFLVRSERPFLITGVEGLGEEFEVTSPTAGQSAASHVLMVVYRPNDQSVDAPGIDARSLRIRTDLPGDTGAVLQVAIRRR